MFICVIWNRPIYKYCDAIHNEMTTSQAKQFGKLQKKSSKAIFYSLIWVVENRSIFMYSNTSYKERVGPQKAVVEGVEIYLENPPNLFW